MSKVVTFGEIRNPDTNCITIECTDRFQCPCGEVQPPLGPWVAAHWRDVLTNRCKSCGTEFELFAGVVTLKTERWLSANQQAAQAGE